ncbi:hypothetical protein KAR91_62230 [Candidatus Pacearchaeota archaeon]|nr:hypothetical protein [Candidatus Pacearchaeota archaeon]
MTGTQRQKVKETMIRKYELIQKQRKLRRELDEVKKEIKSLANHRVAKEFNVGLHVSYAYSL